MIETTTETTTGPTPTHQMTLDDVLLGPVPGVTIELQAGALRAALRTTLAPTKSSLAILHHGLLSVTAKRIALATTNLEGWLEVAFALPTEARIVALEPATLDTDDPDWRIEALLPVHTLAKTLAKTPAKSVVRLTLTGAPREANQPVRHSLTVQSDGVTQRFGGLLPSVTEYPNANFFDDVVAQDPLLAEGRLRGYVGWVAAGEDARAFLAGVKALSQTAAQDMARPVFASIAFQRVPAGDGSPAQDTVELVASDSFRISVFRPAWQDAPAWENADAAPRGALAHALVYAATCQKGLGAFTGKGDVTVHLKRAGIQLTELVPNPQGGSFYRARLWLQRGDAAGAMAYPNYQQIVRPLRPALRFHLPVEALNAILARVGRGQPVTFTWPAPQVDEAGLVTPGVRPDFADPDAGPRFPTTLQVRATDAASDDLSEITVTLPATVEALADAQPPESAAFILNRTYLAQALNPLLPSVATPDVTIEYQRVPNAPLRIWRELPGAQEERTRRRAAREVAPLEAFAPFAAANVFGQVRPAPSLTSTASTASTASDESVDAPDGAAAPEETPAVFVDRVWEQQRLITVLMPLYNTR